MRTTREDLIVLSEEDSMQKHIHSVAACQGLQGPNIPDYSNDFFSKSKIINHVTYLVQCVKDLGKN